MDPNTPGGFGGQPPQQQQAWPQAQQAPAAGGPPFASAKSAGYVPGDEEKQQAFYAHLFAAGTVFALCGLGVVGALVPMFMAKQRTPFLMYHVNQSFWFQAVVFGVNLVLLAIAFVLTFLCIGWLLFPLNGILYLLAIIYPIVVGLKVKEGEWTEYAVIGGKVLGQKSPIFK